MFTRAMVKTISRYAKFPAVALLGPRQAGKSTLAKMAFPHHKFLSLDLAQNRSFAQEDPQGFLQMHENEHGLILDEFQTVPHLASYIKLEIDKKRRPGYFVVTGSQNFLMNKAITESLAGRVGILDLLPLSLAELTKNKILPDTLNETLLLGGYPRLYDEKISPQDLYPSYIQSYIERDVRQLINVGNLADFQRFVQLCAGRIGQEVNVSALASECGITGPTAKQWMSILQASYIVFFLQPHFKNFTKRLVKKQKLYFFDTGLACSLLRILTPQELINSPFRGPLVESLIIADLYKQYANLGMRPSLYFWRDISEKHEVDCIVDEGSSLFPVEIKSGMTINSDFFSGVEYWSNLAQQDPAQGIIVYGGDEKQERKRGTVVGWREAGGLIDRLLKRKRKQAKVAKN